jgi:succinate-semialdehyde dehydrogenase/glutarate-semialdehyde dehydrogenase
LIQDAVYNEFLQKFAAAVAQLKTGNGTEDDVAIGPMISAGAVDSVMSLIENAVANGAAVAMGGQRSELGACFLEPTILTNVSTEMRVYKEEIFGPVAPLFRFKTEEDAIAIANDTEYGLASYFYARDVGRIWRVGERLDYGMVGVNVGIIANEMAPFGGIKESGQGREGSKYGLEDYLEIKYLCVGGLDP